MPKPATRFHPHQLNRSRNPNRGPAHGVWYAQGREFLRLKRSLLGIGMDFCQARNRQSEATVIVWEGVLRSRVRSNPPSPPAPQVDGVFGYRNEKRLDVHLLIDSPWFLRLFGTG